MDDINAAAAAAPVSPRLVVTADGIRGEERWHTEHGGNAALAAIAAEAIGLRRQRAARAPAPLRQPGLLDALPR